MTAGMVCKTCRVQSSTEEIKDESGDVVTLRCPECDSKKLAMIPPKETEVQAQ